MRIAYVGLSTPLFYDYMNSASKAPSDMSSSPNPILDSPFGLMLLFDEIWFACRSLCPENMRNLSYVKFIDEEKILPSLDDIQFLDFQEIVDSNNILIQNYERFRSNMRYGDMVKKIVRWDAAPDNHTHRLKMGDIEVNGNSTNLNNLLLDMEIVKRLGNPNIELITNSFSQRWFENDYNPVIETKLAELMIIDNIPNYLTPKGPYHFCIEEAREDTYLKDFRKWISKQPKDIDETELLEIKNSVRTEIQNIQDELFLKYLNPRTQYKTVGKIVAGEVANVVIPGISAVASIAEEFKTFFKNRERKWQGFIVSSRNWSKMG